MIQLPSEIKGGRGGGGMENIIYPKKEPQHFGAFSVILGKMLMYVFVEDKGD